MVDSNRPMFQEEHHLYRQSVRRFFETEVEPAVGEWEKAGMIDREMFTKAGRAGILAPHIPEEYGGGGGDLLHQIVLYEEHGYSRAGASIGGGLCPDIVSELVYRSGTEEQKQYWLPRYASGEVVSDALVTEPHSGSDVASVRTHAKRAGGDYVINGSKMWITHLHLSDVLPTLVRTGDDGRGMSMFMIDPKLPGVTIPRPIATMSKGISNEGMVFFDDVRVPAEALLGGVEGKGMTHALSILTLGRLAMAARMIAACELALQLTVEFVRERKAFGQRVLNFQNTQFRLADMKTEIAVGKAFLDSLLVKMMEGTIKDEESSMAKLWLSELEGRVMDQAVQLHGGMGFADENLISRMYTMARVHRIFLGTSEIHRMIIGRSIK